MNVFVEFHSQWLIINFKLISVAIELPIRAVSGRQRRFPSNPSHIEQVPEQVYKPDR